MDILKIELTNIIKTNESYNHVVEVTYRSCVLKRTYTATIDLLLYFKTQDMEVIDYMIRSWKYSELVQHSLDMHRLENN